MRAVRAGAGALLAGLLAVGTGPLAAPCLAAAMGPAGQAEAIIAARQDLTLEIHEGQLVRLPRPAAPVFVADPEIADVQAHSPTLVYVFGKRSGGTTLFAIDEHEQVLLSRRLRVDHQLAALQRILQAVVPDAALEVRSVDGALVVDGTVRDPIAAQDVREVASRFLGENESLINRVTVSSPTQVNLRVRVAELSRDVTRLLGVNWEAAISSISGITVAMATGRPFTTAGGFPFQRYVDQNGAANQLGFRYGTDDFGINNPIDALERDRLVNVLAEPNLTDLFGETASTTLAATVQGAAG